MAAASSRPEGACAQRIALFTDRAGADPALLRLASALAERRSTTLVAPPGELLESAGHAGLATIALPPLQSRWVQGVPVVRGRALLEIAARFDVAHAHSLHVLPGLLGHPALAWTVQGDWELPRGLRAYRLGRDLRQVFTVSHALARACAFGPVPVIVLPPGAVREDACRDGLPASACLADRAALRIGVAGGLERAGGQDLALAAIDAVLAGAPRRRVTLAFGGGPVADGPAAPSYAAALRAVAARLEQARPGVTIEFDAAPADALHFAVGLDLLCVAARDGAEAGACVAALAGGVPVIAPEGSAAAEVIDSPALGLCFRPGDAQSLADAIGRAIGGHRFAPAAMSARARECSVERQRDRLLHAYDSPDGRASVTVTGDACGSGGAAPVRSRRSSAVPE